MPAVLKGVNLTPGGVKAFLGFEVSNLGEERFWQYHFSLWVDKKCTPAILILGSNNYISFIYKLKLHVHTCKCIWYREFFALIRQFQQGTTPYVKMLWMMDDTTQGFGVTFWGS